MRPEAEIRAVIEDIKFVLALPGDAGYKEAVMAINLNILQWVLGADNETVAAFAELKLAVAEAYGILERERAAKDRRN